MKQITLIITMLAAAVLFTACDNNKFKVQGTIQNATDSTALVLEQSTNGQWMFIDSVKVNGNGHFSVSVPAPEVPGIYQLRCGGQAICFPIDSLESLTINTTLDGFATDYDIQGSDNAVQVMHIDKQAMRFASGQADAAQYEQWKDSLSRSIASDPKGIVAYYAINKYINGQPLYDPMNDKDLRIIGAVANAFNAYRPNDPRTNYLVQVLLDGQRRRRSMSAPSDTIFADVASLIDIKLQDYNGKEHSLKQVAANNRIVLLDFIIYQTEVSPMLNKLLNDIYKQHGGKGLEIYQIGLDTDNVAWRQAAQNLPWITVYDPMGVNSQTVGAYNVTGMPTTFIIRNGEIVERVEDATQLQKAVARYL